MRFYLSPRPLSEVLTGFFFIFNTGRIRTINSLALLLFIGWFAGACSKEPAVPPKDSYVGQWDLDRYIILGAPSSYSVNGTFNGRLFTEKYVFKDDIFYTFTSDRDHSDPYFGYGGISKEEGLWFRDFGNSTNVLLNPYSSNYTNVPAYNLFYSATGNELSTGPQSDSTWLVDYTTGLAEKITYKKEFIYKLKK